MRSLADTARLHMILGNHDGNLVNSGRQDAITPIFDALNHPNAFLYKKSGIYPTGVPGYNWAVFSCFDEEGWKDVKPVEGEINIATFHGCVVGSKTDQNWELEGDVPLSFFDPYDFTMLGDIHKFQIPCAGDFSRWRSHWCIFCRILKHIQEAALEFNPGDVQLSSLQHRERARGERRHE